MNTNRSLVKSDAVGSDTTTRRRKTGKAAVRRMFVFAALCCVGLSSTGCTSGCDPLRMGTACERWRSQKMTRIDACLAWGGCKNKCAGSEFAPDIKRGFVAGYMATCEGGDGRVPIVPERRYWSDWYRCEYGQRCVNAWFMGYPQGVAAARSNGYHRLQAPEITLAQWRDPSTFTQMAPAQQPVHSPDVMTVPHAVSQPGTFQMPVTPVPQTREMVGPVTQGPVTQGIRSQPGQVVSPNTIQFGTPGPIVQQPVPQSTQPRTEFLKSPESVMAQPETIHIMPNLDESSRQANVPLNAGAPRGFEELPREFNGRGTLGKRPQNVDEMPSPSSTSELPHPHYE